MNQIVEFFTKGGQDVEGRTIDEMLRYSDDEFEASHSFIQWLFPLHEKSYHARYSPVLSPEDVDVLRRDSGAVMNMAEAVGRMRSFLGFGEDWGKIADEKRVKWWAHNGNHNLLRITRVIRSMRLFGFEAQAKKFYTEVWQVAQDYGLSQATMDFWARAALAPVWDSMTDKFLEQKRIEL